MIDPDKIVDYARRLHQHASLRTNDSVQESVRKRVCMAAESYWQNRQPGRPFLKTQLSPTSSVVANRLARAMLRSQKLKLVTLTDAPDRLNGDSTLQSAVVANRLAYAMLRSEKLKLEPHARPSDFPDGDSLLKSAKTSLVSPTQSSNKHESKSHSKRKAAVVIILIAFLWLIALTLSQNLVAATQSVAIAIVWLLFHAGLKAIQEARVVRRRRIPAGIIGFVMLLLSLFAIVSIFIALDYGNWGRGPGGGYHGPRYRPPR